MNHTDENPPRQTDHASIRQFLRAAEIVVAARRLDDFWAEVRAKRPQHGAYWATTGQRMFASDLSALVPKEFGTPEEISAIALEEVAGSQDRTMLLAMVQIAREIKADEAKEPKAQRAPLATPEPDPPGPPADWKSSHETETAPIKIESAAEVPASVRLARARKAAGK
jgi:hypothetical protein